MGIAVCENWGLLTRGPIIFCLVLLVFILGSLYCDSYSFSNTACDSGLWRHLDICKSLRVPSTSECSGMFWYSITLHSHIMRGFQDPRIANPNP